MEKIFILSISSFLFTFIGTRFLKNYLENKKIFDVPNKRSSHIKPVPTGGGWIINLCVIGIIFFLNPYDKIPAILAITGLSLISWYDDLKNINIIIRLVFQFFFILIYFAFLYNFGFYDYSQITHIFFAIIICTWFINIFNFMDGIDGLSSIMTMSLCFGIILSYFLINSSYFPAFEILIIIICSAFLYWNWYPAKIFLGDVGSIVLGFVCFLSLYWLFLEKNTWHWVLSLPMYYILDTTLTLVKRLLNKKKIWQAHREHYYQKAIQSGMTHAQVVLLFIVLQILIIMTCYFVKNPYIAVSLAFFQSLGLIIYFSSKYKKST